MNEDNILDELNTVFREVLDNETLTVNAVTTANEVDEWDSLTHIQLVAAVEKRFAVRFLAAEIQRFANVGDMCAAIARKRTAR
jgi:acyl carrier protein